MYKNIILTVLTIVIFSGCFSVSTNLLRFGELDNDVANQEEIVNNFEGTILKVETSPDTENLSVILPKDNMTVRVRVKVANIEDVLYMNIVSNDEFKIDKIIRRVSSLDELDLDQDGWIFEPSVEKGVVTLQLYLPSIYLYSSQYNPTLLFAYKRNSRSMQESIKFNFIRQYYFPTHDEDGKEIAAYGGLEKYCLEGGKNLGEEFNLQIENLNNNRVEQELKTKLEGICE